MIGSHWLAQGSSSVPVHSAKAAVFTSANPEDHMKCGASLAYLRIQSSGALGMQMLRRASQIRSFPRNLKTGGVMESSAGEEGNASPSCQVKWELFV